MSKPSKGSNDSPSGASKKESRKTISGTSISAARDLASRSTSTTSSASAGPGANGPKTDEEGLIYDHETGFIKGTLNHAQKTALSGFQVFLFRVAPAVVFRSSLQEWLECTSFFVFAFPNFVFANAVSAVANFSRSSDLAPLFGHVLPVSGHLAQFDFATALLHSPTIISSLALLAT